MKRPKVMMVITNRNLTEKVLKELNLLNIHFIDVMLGKGTAKSEFVSLLGLGETERAVFLFYVDEPDVQLVFDMLKTKFDFSSPGKGIAFTMPISAVGGPATLRLFDRKRS